MIIFPQLLVEIVPETLSLFTQVTLLRAGESDKMATDD